MTSDCFPERCSPSKMGPIFKGKNWQLKELALIERDCNNERGRSGLKVIKKFHAQLS